ncbi:unnamed protein product [Spirodela intermedia]|uniref:Phytocyanin domain-containing protein n=1 Tax=Spirodela intermedia TaxID=51605 RepID=A0A7I8JSZ0_SPIIN|nr:unnamed protein product [Spirodela intermedia]CAA6672875.1 unnamed protein product [Spirodela intermedia]
MKRGRLTALCLALSLAASVAAGEQVQGGRRGGWREPDPAHADMYALWAGRTTFRAGDSLYFEYSSEDSVLLVDKRGYYHCNTTNATAAFHDGKTLFPLPAAALLYFISGASGHCPHGQRLIIDVLPPAVTPVPSLPPMAARHPPSHRWRHRHPPSHRWRPPPSFPPVEAATPSTGGDPPPSHSPPPSSHRWRHRCPAPPTRTGGGGSRLPGDDGCGFPVNGGSFFIFPFQVFSSPPVDFSQLN